MRDTAAKVLADIGEHHEWQYENYGGVNRDLPDGTGKDVEWLTPITANVAEGAGEPHQPYALAAFDIEGLFRKEWDYPKDGTPEQQAEAIAKCSWMRLLREEVAEAFAQEDPEWLENELIQVAAVCVSWVATIRERKQS